MLLTASIPDLVPIYEYNMCQVIWWRNLEDWEEKF